MKLGQYEEAEAELQLNLELGPDLWNHHRGMGWLFLVSDKLEEARQHFQQEPQDRFRLHGLAMVAFS